MRSIGIVGAGTMGTGIAQVALQAGMTVTIIDQDPRAAAGATDRISRGLQGAVERGKLTPEARDEAVDRLQVAAQLEDVAGADVIVEAISENLAAKRTVFEALDRMCPHETILATNTSSLSITALAAATARPDRVVGMHFFNPVPAMRLVEVVPGMVTATAVVRAVTELARALGKTPVESGNRPGFIVNRITSPFYGEALRLLEEGAATVATIDGAIKAMGFRMGPFELMDLVGLDVCQAISVAMHEATFGEPRFRPHPRLAEMVDAGMLGRKSGEGFHEYRTR
jgi:3-hydroxybutyryl-CoA dehydrogenase